MQADELVEYIEDFLHGCEGATVVEAVVDTSTNRKGQVTPYLNVWAWKSLDGSTLDKVLAKTAARGDLPAFYDAMNEESSTTFEWELSDIYTRWPEDLGSGDRVLCKVIEDAARSAGFASPIVFHHVDALPLEPIGSAK